MKKCFGFFFILFTMSFLLVACSDGGEEDNQGNGDEGEILSIGDTASVESTVGEYDISFDSFQLLDEFEEYSSENGNYVLVDYTATNTGDETLEANDIYNAKLSNPDEEHGGSRGNSFFYESIVAEGPIEPGESMEGQFIFDFDVVDQYRLIHNFALPATEITWDFSVEEASN